MLRQEVRRAFREYRKAVKALVEGDTGSPEPLMVVGFDAATNEYSLMWTDASLTKEGARMMAFYIELVSEYWCMDVDTDMECPICMEMGGFFIETSCKHVFHAQCLMQWYEWKNTCPNCRAVQ